MVVVGVLVWAGENTANDADNHPRHPSTLLGVLLSLAVVALGYLLLVRFRHGPLATAGVAASALGVPVMLGFLTFQPSTSDNDAFFVLPLNLDVIALVSLAAWLVGFSVVPHAKGRAFYLAASTVVLWLYVVEKVEKGAVGYLITLPYGAFLVSFARAFDEASAPKLPSPTKVGVTSLLFGLGFYAVAVWLDRQGHRGSATPFAGTALVATVVGIGHLAGDLEATGTGLFLIAIGAVMAIYGATQGRRITTWGWAFGIGLGVVLVIADVFDDNATAFGAFAIALGAIVVLLAQVLSDRFSEPDELQPGPSTFTSQKALPPGPPPPPPPWGPAPPQPPPPGGFSTF
jgi:hypothetical protein